MSWIKLDDALPDHRKFEGLSDKAFRLYVYGLCLCGRKLTDGNLSETDVRVLFAQTGGKPRHVRELEDAGLWIRTNGHMVVNGYLEYNPSAEKVMHDREEAKARMRELRAARSGERSGWSA